MLYVNKPLVFIHLISYHLYCLCHLCLVPVWSWWHSWCSP